MGQDDFNKGRNFGGITDLDSLLRGCRTNAKRIADDLMKAKDKLTKPQVNPDIPEYPEISYGDNPYAKKMAEAEQEIARNNALLANNITEIVGNKEEYNSVKSQEIKEIEKHLSDTRRQIEEMSQLLDGPINSHDLTSFTGNMESVPKIDSERELPSYATIAAFEKKRNEIIEEIIKKMDEAGEFDYTTIEDVVRRVEEKNFIRRKLRGTRTEELEAMLKSYSEKKEDSDDYKSMK